MCENRHGYSYWTLIALVQMMAILFQNLLDTNIMVKSLTNIITEEFLLNKYVNS
jgi:hypothetical protein